MKFMQDPRVIKTNRMPGKIPLNFTAITYLLLDKFKSPGWVWGVCGTVLFAMWCSCIARLIVQNEIDVFAPLTEAEKGK